MSSESAGPTCGGSTRWFDLGARAVANMAPDIDDLYACPCCLMLLGRDALADGRLTVEHVPPAAVGGRPLVLTCKGCNSTAGHALDAHAERAEAHLDFIHSTSSRPLRGTITTDGVPLVGEVQGTPGGLLFLGVPKANHPDRPAEVVDAFERMRAVDRPLHGIIRFTSRERWSERAAATSWMRAAYLVGFALLGYAYILRPEFEAVRAAFADPALGPDPVPVLTEPQEPMGRLEVFVITEPAWLHSLVVRIGRHTVFLPARFPDPEFFPRLTADVAARRDGLSGTWEVVPFRWPNEPELRMDNTAS